MTKAILRRLKFDNDTLGKVTKLVQFHDYRIPADPKRVRRAMNKIGEDLFPYYLEVRTADTLAQSEYMREEKLQNILGILHTYRNCCGNTRSCKIIGKNIFRITSKGIKKCQRIKTAKKAEDCFRF